MARLFVGVFALVVASVECNAQVDTLAGCLMDGYQIAGYQVDFNGERYSVLLHKKGPDRGSVVICTLEPNKGDWLRRFHTVGCSAVE